MPVRRPVGTLDETGHAGVIEEEIPILKGGQLPKVRRISGGIIRTYKSWL